MVEKSRYDKSQDLLKTLLSLGHIKDFITSAIEYSTISTKKWKDRIEKIIKKIKITIPESSYKTPSLVGDLVSYGDIVFLITPIDIEAPTGRMILPQVQAIRDILDNDAVAIVLKEREVDAFLRKDSASSPTTSLQCFPPFQ